MFAHYIAEFFQKDIVDVKGGFVFATLKNITETCFYRAINKFKTSCGIFSEKFYALQEVVQILQTADCRIHPPLHMVRRSVLTKGDALLVYSPHKAGVRYAQKFFGGKKYFQRPNVIFRADQIRKCYIVIDKQTFSYQAECRRHPIIYIK